MFNFTLEQGSSLSTMLAVAVGAIALSAVGYYRAFGQLRASQWQPLLALRILAIVLILLLLFRPVLSYQKVLEKKRALVVAIDTSSSMSIDTTQVQANSSEIATNAYSQGQATGGVEPTQGGSIDALA